MPQIRPLSDLQDKLNDIYEVIHKTDQPMFFTRDGQNDVVIMSYDTYNRNFNNNYDVSTRPTEPQSYVRTIIEDPTPPVEEKSSEEILREARRKIQDIVDEYSNEYNIPIPETKPKKRRRRRPTPPPQQ